MPEPGKLVVCWSSGAKGKRRARSSSLRAGVADAGAASQKCLPLCVSFSPTPPNSPPPGRKLHKLRVFPSAPAVEEAQGPTDSVAVRCDGRKVRKRCCPRAHEAMKPCLAGALSLRQNPCRFSWLCRAVHRTVLSAFDRTGLRRKKHVLMIQRWYLKVCTVNQRGVI